MKRRRREFSTKVKIEAFERAQGRCQNCTAALRPGKYRYDHILPCALGGESDLDNCQLLCANCDATKTYRYDFKAIAKGKRIRARFLAARAPRNPIAGGRSDPRKRTMDGRIIDRRTGAPWGGWRR